MTRDGKGPGGSERWEDQPENQERQKHASWCDYPSGPCDCGYDKNPA